MEPPPEKMGAAAESVVSTDEEADDSPGVEPDSITSDVKVDIVATSDDTEPAAAANPPVAATDADTALPNADVSTPVASHDSNASDSTAAATTTQIAAAAAVPSSATYSWRSAPGRLGLVQLQGGSTKTEAAVIAALAWLAKVQSADGRWDANRYGAGQEHSVLGHNRGGAGRNADTGISSLAILAFLGAGHSHLQGDYQDTVRRGLEFLIRSQASDGSLFGDSTLYAQMYCHSMATFALAEAQAMTGDARLRTAVARPSSFPFERSTLRRAAGVIGPQSMRVTRVSWVGR
jgi:hypothetical protein